ncbi:YsnF/AvaK domain-containing protein [Chamaesiphon sp.]|uniref:YsnF/AvaK domain-containing protein n=1 Tax=Chamaesiphon sp. TaxID=2814140 RepID=UPI003593FA19
MTSDQYRDSQQHPVDATPQEQPIQYQQHSTSVSQTLTEEVFSLLEERLIVSLSKRKIGEIVVRKEVETQIVQVQVPIQREKLIVEQVSPEYKLLAQIDLGQANLPNIALADPTNGKLKLVNNTNPSTSTRLNHSSQPTVAGEIASPTAASQLLKEIANMPSADWETVRIEIVLKDAKHQDNYQALFDRYCQT